MTVLETIQRSTDFLTRKGVESPRLQAELLLAQVLKLPRMRLYLNFERTLTESEMSAMREGVMRRATREPLQQIIGATSFCGLEILVNRHVLVPRPETELLAEKGWRFMQELPGCGQVREPRALDFGTGSGCLAVALARNCPAAIVDALEISSESLAVARKNAEGNAVADRIHFIEGGSFKDLPAGARYQLVISNPPYIPSDEVEQLAPEVRDFEPRHALDGGQDGLDYYRRFAVEAQPWLAPGGRIMMEFGDGQAEAIVRLFREQKWIVEDPQPDYTGRLRLLAAGRP